MSLHNRPAGPHFGGNRKATRRVAAVVQQRIPVKESGAITKIDLKKDYGFLYRAPAKAPQAAAARIITLKEGRAVQVMHVGPYDAETATIERLEAFARESGFELSGKHHEIYLGDPRRAAPEKLRTILRHPVR
jgi:effector-binding domain-containing protein